MEPRDYVDTAAALEHYTVEVGVGAAASMFRVPGKAACRSSSVKRAAGLRSAAAPPCAAGLPRVSIISL